MLILQGVGDIDIAQPGRRMLHSPISRGVMNFIVLLAPALLTIRQDIQ